MTRPNKDLRSCDSVRSQSKTNAFPRLGLAQTSFNSGRLSALFFLVQASHGVGVNAALALFFRLPELLGRFILRRRASSAPRRR